MCELNATKEQVNVIIQRLEDAISVCYTAPENPKEEGYPYATGFARSAMQGAIEDLTTLMQLQAQYDLESGWFPWYN